MKSWSLGPQLEENIGTPGHPESLLHRYACAMVWEELHYRGIFTGSPWSRREKEPVVVNTPTGPSNDLWDRVTTYEMGTYLNSVLGRVPDMIGRGSGGRPEKVIEVVVSSFPKADYRTSLEKHEIELVEIHVPDADSLARIFVREDAPYAYNNKGKANQRRFSSTIPDYRAPRFREGTFRGRQDRANNAIVNLINDLRDCDPWYRRAFLELLEGMTELDSLFPVFQPQSNPFLSDLVVHQCWIEG